MSGPVTVFDADECLALLDLMDHILGDLGLPHIVDKFVHTSEESAALGKLRQAGKFYARKVGQQE
jgi:hypothetical protein